MGFSLFAKPVAETRLVHANQAAANAEFPNNAISNTKYNVFSFIPKNLWEQFRCAPMMAKTTLGDGKDHDATPWSCNELVLLALGYIAA